jgi:hypothetical protein
MPPRARSLLALAAVIVVGLAFAAAGCGGDSDDASAPPETTTAATTGTETEAATTTGTTTSDDDNDTTTGDDDDTGIEDDTTTSDDDTSGPPTASRGGTTSSGSGSGRRPIIVAPVETTLFRTGGNTIICGLERSALLCWRPATGFTIRLRSSGIPKEDFVRANRGLPRRVRSIPLLRKGRAVRRGGFRCMLAGKGEVRCTNRARHGFQLGKLLSYRF